MAKHDFAEDLSRLLKKEGDRLRKVDMTELLNQFEASKKPTVERYAKALKDGFATDFSKTTQRKFDLNIISEAEAQRKIVAMQEFVNRQLQIFRTAGVPQQRKMLEEVLNSAVTRSSSEINRGLTDEFFRSGAREPGTTTTIAPPAGIEQIGFRSLLDRATRPSLGNYLGKKFFGKKNQGLERSFAPPTEIPGQNLPRPQPGDILDRLESNQTDRERRIRALKLGIRI